MHAHQREQVHEAYRMEAMEAQSAFEEARQEALMERDEARRKLKRLEEAYNQLEDYASRQHHDLEAIRVRVRLCLTATS